MLQLLCSYQHVTKKKKSQRSRWFYIIIYLLCHNFITLYSCICESTHDTCFMLQYHFYAVFLDRSFSFFAKIDVIVIDVVKMMLVESCDAAKIDVTVITEITENSCKKTSTNLKTIVKDFLSRRSTNDLLTNFVLFFLASSRCSNFFIKFKQLFKYDMNFHSLNSDSYSSYLTKYCVTIIRPNFRKRLTSTFFTS